MASIKSDYQLERSPLWLDIKKIIYTDQKPVRFELRGMLHTEKEDIPIMKIISIDTVRDYVMNIGDHIHIEFKMPLGEYAIRLYPYRNNLEFTIKSITLEAVQSIKDKKYPTTTERFKAVFLLNENPIVQANEMEMNDPESLNKVAIIDVKLQLIDRALEPLRIKTLGGIFRDYTQKELIHSLLGGESLKVLVDGKPSIEGLDIVDPDNSEKIKHSIIPDGMNLTTLTTHIQENMSGVYNAGIGTYLQTFKKKKFWFVYPLYNTKRFDDPVDKVIFYSVLQEKMPGHDRTYRKEEDVLHVIVSAAKKYQDSAESDYMNFGVGFRTSNANSYMKKPVTITEDGPIGERARLNTEVAIEDRKDSLNYMPLTSKMVNDNPFTNHRGISNNPFVDYSNVNARNTARIDMSWDNADHSLIRPGMPCKYVFLDRDKLIELKGTILFIHALTSLQGSSITEKTYRTVCTVTIVTEKYTLQPEISKIQPYGIF